MTQEMFPPMPLKIITALLVGLALVAAGCGSGQERSQTMPSQGEATTQTQTTTPTKTTPETPEQEAKSGKYTPEEVSRLVECAEHHPAACVAVEQQAAKEGH
jgi:PBP1b-binding outer membrane lipoprotein LpoB